MEKKLSFLVVIAVLAGCAYFVFHKKSDSPLVTASANKQTVSPEGEIAATATITFNGSVFSPAETRVKSGDTITITNTSSTGLEFHSNPYPTHNDDDELNVGTISPGTSKSFVVSKKGSFEVHNHLNTDQTATIIIE